MSAVLLLPSIAIVFVLGRAMALHPVLGVDANVS
jgi:hypothetical protein